MEIIHLDFENSGKLDSQIDEAVKFLRMGKTVVYPTDTVYGLGCDANNEKAIQRISQIKSRQSEKAYSVIVRDIEEIAEIAFLSTREKEIINKLLPGPFTVILIKKRIGKAEELKIGKEKTIGIRIPESEIVQMLADKFENPIITTSVNLSGENPLSDPFQIVEYFSEKSQQPDLILSGREIKNAQPSTVIDLTTSRPKILRKGAMSVQETLSLLEKLQ